MTIYLLAGVLFLGDLALVAIYLRERRQHRRTAESLRFWQHHSIFNPSWGQK